MRPQSIVPRQQRRCPSRQPAPVVTPKKPIVSAEIVGFPVQEPTAHPASRPKVPVREAFPWDEDNALTLMDGLLADTLASLLDDRTSKREFVEALEWVFEENARRGFSFMACCRVLGLDPNNMREALLDDPDILRRCNWVNPGLYPFLVGESDAIKNRAPAKAPRNPEVHHELRLVG